MTGAFRREKLDFLPRERYKKILCIIAYTAAGAAVLYVFFKYALGALLPFILAWAVAAVLQRPVVFAHKKLKIPKMLAAAVIVVLFVAASSLIIFAAFSTLIRQAGEFVSSLARDGAGLAEKLDELVSNAGGALEKIGIKAEAGSASMIFDAVGAMISAAASKTTEFAAGLAGMLPRVFLFMAALILSSVYFCAEYRSVADFVLKKLPRRASAVVSAVKRECDGVMKNYVRAYALLFLLTFGEVFLGLTLIGINDALLLSLIVAFVDFLPVFGTGAVLVPWALALLVLGDVKTAIFIAVLYAVISIIRQFAEPRIVGGGIGLHPVVSLMMMYLGLRLLGFFGMICAPLLFAVVKNTVKALRAAPA